MRSVFISGSISIRKIPKKVEESLKNIIRNNFKVYVGDAEGVDSLIQRFFYRENYFNVVVVSIYAKPRNLVSEKFEFLWIPVEENLKSEKKRQEVKDKYMTDISEYSFVIWDGKSSGSYSNIVRALQNKKPVKVFLNPEDRFLDKEEITEENIERIYRENSGYSSSEAFEILKNKLNISKISDMYDFLVKKGILIKENRKYFPTEDYKDLFIVTKYKGKSAGVKFKEKFFETIAKEIGESREEKPKQKLLPLDF